MDKPPKQNSIEGSASSMPGIPSWLMKSRSRYNDDEDDIQFSLPSGDDGAFFSLHFGDREETVSASPHQSTFDRINQELGFSKVGSSSALGVSPSKGSGICLSAELPQAAPKAEEQKAVQPRQRKRTIVNQSAPVIPKFHVGDDSDTEGGDTLADLKKANLSAEKADPHTTGLAKDLTEKLNVIAENKNLGILSKVQNYFMRTEPATPVPSAVSSPKTLRKTSVPISKLDLSKLDPSVANSIKSQEEKQLFTSGAVVQERKMSYNAYFYRPEQDTSNKKVALSPEAVSKAASPLTGESSKNLQGPIPSAAESQSPSKTYRPKASKLREMNFWAPTSM